MQVSKSRRKGADPVPINLDTFLTKEQAKVLPRLEKQGVSVFAVRRPLFQDPVVILKFLSRRGYGVLLQNGDVDYFPDIVVRGETRSEGSKSVESFRSGFSQRGTVD